VIVLRNLYGREEVPDLKQTLESLRRIGQ
jgi:hypothetical protein